MNLKIRIVSIVACVVLAAGSAFAADAELAVDILQGYVWRGMTFNDGVVVQPSVDVSLPAGLGLNVWANFDIGDYDDGLESGEFSEVDLCLYYSKECGPVEVGAGYIEYLYPFTSTNVGGWVGTRELYVTVGGAMVGGLSAALEVYYDIDEVDNYYANLGLSYCQEMDKLSLEVGGAIGYVGEGANGESGMNDYNLSLSTSYQATEAVSVGATIAYTGSMDEDILPEQDVNVYGGLNVAMSL